MLRRDARADSVDGRVIRGSHPGTVARRAFACVHVRSHVLARVREFACVHVFDVLSAFIEGQPFFEENDLW